MRGSELAGPQDVAARVVLDDEGVIRKAPVRSPVRLSGEGAICAPDHIRAGGIHGDGNCLVLTRGSELAGPQDVAARGGLGGGGVAWFRAPLSGGGGSYGAPGRDARADHGGAQHAQ